MESAGRAGLLTQEAVAEQLAALAYPVRLALLDALGEPKSLAEIRVSPQRLEMGENPQRPAAMQTVAAHLERLVDAGFVIVGERERLGRPQRTYAISPQRLYALTEELRRLGVRLVGRGRGTDATETVMAGVQGSASRGPRLVLAHGVGEGRVFDLSGPEPGRWRIGRRPELEVPLDYDPYVSGLHATVVRRSGKVLLLDAGESKNGSYVNWQRVPPGRERELAAGDVVGVGRSLLVLQA